MKGILKIGYEKFYLNSCEAMTVCHILEGNNVEETAYSTDFYKVKQDKLEFTVTPVSFIKRAVKEEGEEDALC